ncbi:putative ABC transport system permease protein [Bacilli bacterium PM5-9]|nr:putative ABC transport system permease protein [Bacilli bacterium PM5-9]
MEIILLAISEACLWAILAIGVYLMYKILDIADLSVEGVFPLGAAVCAIMLTNGVNPFLATFLSLMAGMLAGLLGSLLHTKLKIPALLTGILVMSGLYSINLRIMQKPNISLSNVTTVFSALENYISKEYVSLIVGIITLIIVITLLYLFYKTELGLAFIATGDNEVMAQANSINTDNMKIIGYMISNALVALSGALLSQYNGFADAQSGVGTIVIGLAAVIIGGVLVKKATFTKRLMLVVIGAIIYRLIISLALEMNIEATDLKLISAIILAVFLAAPNLKIAKKVKVI